MEKLLELLEQDCTMSIEQMAAAAGMPVDEAKAAIKKYEDERIVLGYKAIIDWDRVRKETVTALIEVNVTPQSIDGFDRSRALIIGDSLTSDIRGGNNAGIQTCWFNPRGAAPLPSIHVDYEVHRLEELKTIL